MDLAKMSVEELDNWCASIDRSEGYMEIALRREKCMNELARRLAEREAEVATPAGERDAARAIVERLPKTKDGVPVFIGDKVWYWIPDGIEEGGASVDLSHAADAQVVCSEDGDGLVAFVGIKGGPAPWTQFPDYLPIGECYSAREAAQRAAGGEVGK